MKNSPIPSFPGGSKSRVTRAGESVRNGSATAEDFHVIDDWRAAHRNVLNTFQAILRQRTRGTNITVAQRHKRKRTIFDKLQRLPGMRLAQMDDVAGCRLIFKRLTDLHAFRKAFLRANLVAQPPTETDFNTGSATLYLKKLLAFTK